MRWFILILGGFLFLTPAPRPSPSLATGSETRPKDGVSVLFSSASGKKLLCESQAQQAFWSLVQYYSPQTDRGSCSVASCTMVLNALPIERPVSEAHKPYRLFTAATFFNKDVQAIITPTKVSFSGMTLNQVSRCLKTYPVSVECVHASTTTVEDFRKLLAEALSTDNKYIIVNYDRRLVGQKAGGHISPLGAYNQQADMVLILDTANYKYPWTWVKVDKLWKAMAETVDPASKRSRGYIIVAAKPEK